MDLQMYSPFYYDCVHELQSIERGLAVDRTPGSTGPGLNLRSISPDTRRRSPRTPAGACVGRPLALVAALLLPQPGREQVHPGPRTLTPHMNRHLDAPEPRRRSPRTPGGACTPPRARPRRKRRPPTPIKAASGIAPAGVMSAPGEHLPVPSLSRWAFPTQTTTHITIRRRRSGRHDWPNVG